MAIHFDLRNLVKTQFAPNRLKNVRVQGWDRILLEMRYWWSIEKETIVETKFYEPLKNVPRQKKPIENW
jgi:hypothetical protein